MLRLTRVFVIGIAVLTVVDAFIEDHEAAEELNLEGAGRYRRATRWTVQPTRNEVSYLTQRTELISMFYRGFISFERWFYDILSTSSKFEVASFLVAGVLLTFVVVFIPLWFLFNAPLLALGRRKRDLFEVDAGHNINQLVDLPLDFKLPDWKEEMSRWAALSRPVGKRFRCCVLPISVRCHLFVEQSPEPCPREHRDVTVDHDFRLTFQ